MQKRLGAWNHRNSKFGSLLFEDNFLEDLRWKVGVVDCGTHRWTGDLSFRTLGQLHVTSLWAPGPADAPSWPLRDFPKSNMCHHPASRWTMQCTVLCSFKLAGQRNKSCSICCIIIKHHIVSCTMRQDNAWYSAPGALYQALCAGCIAPRFAGDSVVCHRQTCCPRP